MSEREELEREYEYHSEEILKAKEEIKEIEKQIQEQEEEKEIEEDKLKYFDLLIRKEIEKFGEDGEEILRELLSAEEAEELLQNLRELNTGRVLEEMLYSALERTYMNWEMTIQENEKLRKEIEKLNSENTDLNKENNKQNELLELLVPKRITVRQLAELIPPERNCYVSGDGNSNYFSGQMKDIPECMMECLVHEISPQIVPASEESNRKFDWELGIYIDSVLLLDLLVKTFPTLNEDSDLIDKYYFHTTENEENLLEILEINKRNRKQKAEGNTYMYKHNYPIFTDNSKERTEEVKDDDFNTEKAVAEFFEMGILSETELEIEDDIPDDFIEQIKKATDNLVDKREFIFKEKITEQQVIACAKTLLENTDNYYLKNVLEELIINGDCMEEDDIYLVVKKICEDGFDITGFGLEEIPHSSVYTFSKKVKELGVYQEFDVYLDYFNGGSEEVTVGYVGDDSCTHNAKTIKEAIEKREEAKKMKNDINCRD